MARGPPKQAFRPPAPVQKATTSQQNASQSQGTTQKGKEKQAQNQDQTIVTKEDSFDILKVTLEANIGIICYLRNLLPEEDFEYFYICGSNAPPAKSPDELYRLTAEEARAWNAKQQAESQFQSQSQSQSQSQGVPHEFSDVRTFSWRKIKDDQSHQGKAICQLLSGAEEAIRKGYLRSLMLIIFLDDEDPTNVIETYTFNFFYHESTGAPSMSVEHSVNRELDQSLKGFALLDKNRILGNPMTHLEVRRMVKNSPVSGLSLRCRRSSLMPLSSSEKRFVDIKLFYNDRAPENYVAPSFADSSEEKLVLGTNDVENPPLWMPFQGFQTGHHGLSLSAVSVTDNLPEIPRGKATGPEDYAARYAEEELVKADAEERDVLWNANADLFRKTAHDLPQDPSGGLKQPIGRRQEDGTIAPIGSSQAGNGIERGRRKRRACEGARYIAEETLQMSQAMSELTPTRGSTRASSSVLSQVKHGKSIEDSLFQQNSQSFTGNHSQIYLDGINETEDDHVNDLSQNIQSVSQSPSLSTQRLADALHRKVQLNKRKGSDEDDTDETQTQPRKPRALKSIVSAAMKNNGYEVKDTGKSRPKPKPQSKPKPKAKRKTTAKPRTKAAAKPRSRQASAQTAVKAQKTVPRKSVCLGNKKIQSKHNDVIECYCGLNDEEGHMILCDGCDKWFHATCLGFIDGSSASQLSVYCIMCEMRNDKKRHWPQEDIDKAVREMGALALLRQVMQELRTRGQLGKDELPELQRQFGCERTDVDLILRKLENEGLVEMLAENSDDSQSSNDWTLKWCKNTDAVNRFVAYFQYGRGIEDELFAVRKWHKRPRINDDASQTIPGSQNGSFLESQTQRSCVHNSNNVNADSDKDADDEEDIEMSNDDTTTTGSSKVSAPYELPFFRSSRAVRVVDCSDVWTEREDDMDEDGANDA
ncbi:hypothetical protein I204_08113 [Kwoniella mangroviensis CBS 8886]|nr:uncharacterized protein I203_04527 [Kwoniella mangroviensis CBS 8507]OCF66201.1 hypothetical protein I203_04527 [Kwoniella mangroviensis CBS 8507]OCF71160.1 hypothetical protein I204_08113 [Kwoniella mangroviensis CBS 8886]